MSPNTAAIDGVVPWPAHVADQYRSAGYWRGVSIASDIAEQVRRYPDREVLVDGSRRLTYSVLWQYSAAAAQALLDLGIASGDRIVLQLPNCWEFAALTIACLRLGIVPIMALPSHGRHEITHIASAADAVAIVVSNSDKDPELRQMVQQVADAVPSIRTILIRGVLSRTHVGSCREYDLAAAWTVTPRFEAADHDPAGSDLACLLLSGGTTGLPKLIARTNDDYAYNIRQCSAVTELSDETTYLCALPASHNFALACPGLLGTLMVGGRVVMLPSPSPARALRTIEAEAVTVTAAVPAVAHSWIEYQRAHQILRSASLRVLQVGGARMPDELAARVRPVLGATLQQVFGMAEGLVNMTHLDDDDEVILSTQGRPISHADEIRIVDGSGNPVPVGTAGALQTRGPYTPRGYFRAPEYNAHAFTPEGWYASGDVVIQRNDGNLVVVGRDKDMINRGGEKISAEEVENFVYRFPGVDGAAAVAMPDPVLGERICLYVSFSEDHSPITLADIVDEMTAAGVARFKLPERLEIVDHLPVSKVGKLDKNALREDIRARLATEEAIGDRSPQ